MPLSSSSLLRLFALGSALMLCSQCSHIYVHEKENPVVDLMDYKQSIDSISSQQELLYDGIYEQIIVARKHENRKPDLAVAIYLQVAEAVWRSKEDGFIPLYNHAIGQAADLIQQRGLRNNGVYQTSSNSYQVQFDSSQSATFSESGFEDIVPVDCLERKGLRTEVSQAGVGAPLVVMHGVDGEKENPFISPIGGDFNTTLLVDFSQKGKAVFRFYDVTKVSTISFWGRQQDMNVNLTAGYYMLAKRKSEGGGASRIMGVFRPMKYSGRMGLYLESRFDPDKIPLILVHGLVSSPMTWADPMNEMLSDPKIRANYQAYTYYYPTGFPVRMTGAKLKEDLLRLEAYARSQGAAENADKMIIFGHSMGGLLTSLNIRELNETTWSKLSNEPIDALRMSDLVKEDFKTIFEKPQPSGIKRAVFISTPHRGSNKANTWYGSFVATLIKIPNNLLVLDFVGAAQSMTDLGKSVFNQDGLMNSMVTLRTGNPALEMVADRPILPRVPYHSIIGDRGKGDTPNSSDGVVPYASSHIEGAESEVIVPSGHSSHHDPAAVKELQRILLKHLKENP